MSDANLAQSRSPLYFVRYVGFKQGFVIVESDSLIALDDSGAPSSFMSCTGSALTWGNAAQKR
jgi:hypothetical protein